MSQTLGLDVPVLERVVCMSLTFILTPNVLHTCNSAKGGDGHVCIGRDFEIFVLNSNPKISKSASNTFDAFNGPTIKNVCTVVSTDDSF